MYVYEYIYVCICTCMSIYICLYENAGRICFLPYSLPYIYIPFLNTYLSSYCLPTSCIPEYIHASLSHTHTLALSLCLSLLPFPPLSTSYCLPIAYIYIYTYIPLSVFLSVSLSLSLSLCPPVPPLNSLLFSRARALSLFSLTVFLSLRAGVCALKLHGWRSLLTHTHTHRCSKQQS